MEAKSLRETLKDSFNIDLPISGGQGSSFDDAIIIETKNSSEGVNMEYTVIKCIHKLGNLGYKVVKQELIPKDNKWYDKLKLEVSNYPDNYHNYYFDITNFYSENP
ncbi:MAG: hypothetical protein NT145_05270 [Elusimicrobia bacterium]|nr:hypothetical protein [Elusimicrobiota bacterium]